MNFTLFRFIMIRSRIIIKNRAQFGFFVGFQPLRIFDCLINEKTTTRMHAFVLVVDFIAKYASFPWPWWFDFCQTIFCGVRFGRLNILKKFGMVLKTFWKLNWRKYRLTLIVLGFGLDFFNFSFFAMSQRPTAKNLSFERKLQIHQWVKFGAKNLNNQANWEISLMMRC